MSERSQVARLRRLLQQQRWAALATVDAQGLPLASMVGYVINAELDTLLLHLSRLAAHTGNLLAKPHASLVVSENDNDKGDPQTLARATLRATASVIARESPDYPACRTAYLAKLPDAERLFEFPDFVLFRLEIEEIRFVGGFAQAFTYRPDELRNR